MKTLKLKRLFTVFIFMATLILGVSLVYQEDYHAVFADEIVVSGDWTNNGDGTYTGKPPKWSSSSATLTLTITGKGVLNYSYKNSEGKLTVTANGTSVLTTSSTSSSFTSAQISLTNNGDNTITFKSEKTSLFGSFSATIGSLSVDRLGYTITATTNNSELGTVEFTNGSYIAGTELSVTAIPNENAIFLGFIDKNNNLLSTNLTYSFLATKEDTITALFETIEGANTQESPLNFNSLIETVGQYCAENSSFTYTKPTTEVCNTLYITASDAFSLSQDGTAVTATDGLYTLSVARGATSTLTFVTGKKSFLYTLSNPGAGLSGTSITLGNGTQTDPYIIKTEENLQDISGALSSVFKIVNDIYITRNFTPIGKSDGKFTGKLLGENFTIYNFKTASGDYKGLFAYTNGGTIQDLKMKNATLSVGSYGAFLIANSDNGTVVSNVHLDGTITATSECIGGIVGCAVEQDGIKASNCTVSGNITCSGGGPVGGLSGTGGTFTGCVVNANITGKQIVGGLTGGYDKTDSDSDKLFGATNSAFTNCYIAGNVAIINQHSNNYPYWGLLNGYGAWTKFTLTSSGQKIKVDYTSSVGVEEIRIFGNNSNADGIVVEAEENNGKYTFAQNVGVSGTSVGGKLNATDLLSETALTGITGNFGGFTVRFKMANGTYKYLSTLNRAQAKYQSIFDINLDTLTSYVDNFSKIEINQSKGTDSYTKSSKVSIWGSAKLSNANDFEHFAWIVNGAIPTTFKNGEFYNARSVVTIGVDFQDDIDLTTLRYARKTDTGTVLITEEEYNNDSSNAFVLNTDNHLPSGNISYEFYGLGKSEMYPYRGSLYGNYKNLTVNMDFPESYLMGIIACATEQENPVVIENLTINGTINGKYRVGIVGMNDNYERSSSLVFTNVTNNADVTAQSQVGGFVGEAQGSAQITIDNCTNNGNVTATNGNAGGFVGSLTQHKSLSEVTLTNSTNNGDVSASNIAGGFVGTSSTVHLNGENVSSGTVSSGTGNANFYVGSFASGKTYDKAEGSTLTTLYTFNVGAPNTELIVNGKNYVSDENGEIQASLTDFPTLNSGDIEAKSPISNEVIDFDVDGDSMSSSIVVPKEIVFADGNIYETTNDSWQINGLVIYTDGSKSTIALTPNLTTEQLNSNQLIFVNVGFTHESYTIPSSLVQTLKRISQGVKDYVTTGKELVTMTSGDFVSCAESVKNAYDTIKTEIETYDADNQSRFEDYISNTITNNENINVGTTMITTYFENIVVSSDLSALENVSIDYGTFEFTKTLTFTMFSGKSETKDIKYTFSKNGTLNVVATTDGISFTANNVTTYSYDEDVNVTINKIDLLGVELESKEVVYNAQSQSVTATLTVKAGDSVSCELLYNGQESVTDVGTYEVSIDSLTGADAVYYNIPTYEKGTLKINPIIVKLEVENKTLTYNKTNQAQQYTLTKLNTSSYELKNDDHTVVYTATNYNSTDKPVNAGDYKAVVTINNNNIAIDGTNEFTFTINKKQITDITFNNEFTYSSKPAKLSFENFVGKVGDDEINVTSSTLYNSAGQTIENATNYGNYSVMINSLSNDNYYVKNLIKTFKINKQIVEITLDNLSSTYGEDLILNELTWTAKGDIYDGDSLNITPKGLPSLKAGEYPLSADYSNENYDVTIIDAIYTIQRKIASINFGTTTFEYNSLNRIEELLPTMVDIIDNDKNDFKFELLQNENVTTEFKNAGDYVLKLIENETTDNYSISVKQKNCKIEKFDLTLKVKSVEKNYNQEIVLENLIESVTLAGNDSLSDVVTATYEVYNGEEKVDYTQTLSVGTYTIKLNIAKQRLYDNYDIKLVDGTLTISERETYIDAEDFEKFYDGEKVVFSAKLFGVDNEEITDANLTYTYFQDNNEIEEVKNVGDYTVKVFASAGLNNKECEQTYKIKIKSNLITINLNNTELTYNAEKYIPDFTYSMSKEVNLENILTYQLLDKNKEEIDEIKNADNYLVKFNLTDNNFALNKDLFTVKINPIDISISLKDREIDYKQEFDITKTQYTITSGEVLKGEALDLTFSVVNFNEVAGEYALTAENKNTNYNVTVTDAIFTVNKRVLNVEFVGSDNLEFDPLGQTELLNAKISNIVSENVYLIYYLNSNNQQTENVYDAGTYTLKIDILDTQNYIFEDEKISISKTIIINKKEMLLNIEISSKIYDAENIKLIDVKCENNSVEKELYNVEYYKGNELISTPKNVGNYIVKINPTLPNNYNFTNNTKSFEIALKDVYINEIQSIYEYTRNTIKPQLSLSNVIDEEDVKIDCTYISNNGEFKNVDTYTIKINGLTGANSANYNLTTTEDILYQIIATNVSVKANANTFTFNNKKLLKSDLQLSFDGKISILDEDYSLSTLPTNAGEYDITITSLNTGINFIEQTIKVIIEKADIEGVKFESKTYPFDNKYHSLEATNLTTNEGVALTAEYTTNNYIDVGTYPISVTLKNDNYNELKLNAILTITQTKISIQATTEKEFTYNKTGQGREIVGLENLWYKDLIEYHYVGEEYNSTQKPIDAGEYKLVISAKNENILLTDNEFDFVINTKAIIIQSLNKQEHTYSACEFEYQVTLVGKLSTDEVSVNVLYDGLTKLPYDAKTYEVSFDRLSGKDAKNYHIDNKDALATLIIKPYLLKVVAHDKTSVYGEAEKELTYTSDKLLANDTLTGNITREKGNTVNSYFITQGTLTAGGNYAIDFENAIYSITQREITYKTFEKEFTYNSQSQIPNIEFNNILTNDKNVVKIVTDGDTVNAGTYTLQLALNNTNYKLIGEKSFTITISKQDISNKIISLVVAEKDYDGKVFMPIVIIDGDYNYTLKYFLNNVAVEEIKDGGLYKIVCELDNQNFKGIKEFNFKVNKINYSNDLISNASVVVYSKSLKVDGIVGDISLSVDNQRYVSGNVISGLEVNTKCQLFVKFAESSNYKETIFSLGEFTTSKCATEMNEKIAELLLDEININDISLIKTIIGDSEELSEAERDILNEENLELLKLNFYEYLDTLTNEIQETKTLSDLVDFDSVKSIINMQYFTAVLGIGMIILKRKKKYERKK